ncbi:MAG TPA: serine/threonine protein phosphatase, partial [Firmicutes bacterium]|nr:serine/threonine protein phosphatase [Bacillota bacterium]
KDYFATIYNFDNPEPVFIRDGSEKKLSYENIEVEGKIIKKASFYFQVDDILTIISDGAVHA